MLFAVRFKRGLAKHVSQHAFSEIKYIAELKLLGTIQQSEVDDEYSQTISERQARVQGHWENDPDADDHLPSPFGDSHNSVISL